MTWKNNLQTDQMLRITSCRSEFKCHLFPIPKNLIFVKKTLIEICLDPIENVRESQRLPFFSYIL